MSSYFYNHARTVKIRADTLDTRRYVGYVHICADMLRYVQIRADAPDTRRYAQRRADTPDTCTRRYVYT